MATRGQARCWLVPGALAERLDDLDGGVALWLLELQQLAQPNGLGWDPSLKIVSPNGADLDSGCFDSGSGDDDTPLARTRKFHDLSETQAPMASSGESSDTCSECSSEDSLEGDEWCVPHEGYHDCRLLPALLEEEEEEDEPVVAKTESGPPAEWAPCRYGGASTEILSWNSPRDPTALTPTPISRSDSELCRTDGYSPRIINAFIPIHYDPSVFPFDLFDEVEFSHATFAQPSFEEVCSEVHEINERMCRLCEEAQPAAWQASQSLDVLDKDLIALLNEADTLADECLSGCTSSAATPICTHSIFDTGDRTSPPVPPIRKKKKAQPRAATSDELLLMTRATEGTKLKRSRSLSGDIRRTSVSSSRVVTSDLLEWKRQLVWSALCSDDDEDDMIIADMKMNKWFSSSDGKGHVYYFEENSNESSWTLPEVALSPQQERERERERDRDREQEREQGIEPDSEQEEAQAPGPHEAQEVSDDEEVDGRAKMLAAELAAHLAKRCRAFPDAAPPTAFSLRAAKSRSMILIDSELKDGSPKETTPPKNWPQLFEGAMHVLKEGTLNRTKITENGKKLRKNWASSHVVLTELCLLLFRDAKTFAAMKAAEKNPGTNVPRPELSLDLNGASIDRVDRSDKLFATSRKNVLLVSTVLGLQVLFQCDTTAQTDEWFSAIHAAIKRLPCGLDSCPRKDSDRLISGPYSPEQNKKFPRIGRSKSVKLKSKDGSIEDLTVSTAERQTKIRARLKKFFNRRPTMESLVKKGIWKDEPAFGCYLEQVCGSESPRVPVFVQKCIAVIESKPDNMQTDGLYRASGNLSQVQKIRLQVDQNNMAILEQEEDVHVLTGALKLFFRELKEPLIPYASFSKAIKASMNHSKKEKLAQFRDIVKSLPAANHDTLKFLLKHLLRVTSYQEYNRMHIPNLAIVFGPTLMWPEQESLNMALDLMQQNLVIETFLVDFDAIFR